MVGFNLPGHAMLIWHVPIRAWPDVVKLHVFTPKEL